MMSTNDDADDTFHNEKALGPEELVRRETKVVNILRFVLFAVLIIVGAFLSIVCYRVTCQLEEEKYNQVFDLVAVRFIGGFHSAMEHTIWNAITIGVAVSASSNFGQAAPNLTLPFFEGLAFGATGLFNLNHVFFAPLLHNEEERKEWEQYAQQQMNQTKSDTSKNVCYACGSPDLEIGTPEVQIFFPGYETYTCGKLNLFASSGALDSANCQTLTSYIKASCACKPKSHENSNSTSNGSNTQPRSQHIYKISGNGTEAVEGSGPSLPIWQVYPPNNVNTFVMYDLFSDPIARVALATMMKTKQTVITKTFGKRAPNLWNVLNGHQEPSWGNLLFSPVFAHTESNEIIGSVVLDIDFTFLIGSDVPVGSNGIQIVLESTCGQQRTYQSDGMIVQFVGDGDLHDSKFSSMMHQSKYEDYLQISKGLNPHHYSGNSSDQGCAYRVSVYASDEFRSVYISNMPRIYAGSVVIIFIFTSLLFLTYDCYVSRRQRMVMQAALQRDEIVSSLFPAAVRQRLFRTGQATRKGPLSYGNARFGASLSRWANPEASRVGDLTSLTRTEPIADFLPMVSVVFADISGFTAWSSEREPSQVFQLLETVYQAFDRLASRSGVFKIETTGDCFVAATGIPVYQPDHAVRIVKFAYECLLHMHELIHGLETTLGPSTSSLSIRIGIHSGPVIAGVLRGDKTRFQLFGDTMNTAARMQTSGEINMIQVSTATADLLTEANKSHWLHPRDKQVALKGKGLVKTYWADPMLSDENTAESQPLSADAASNELRPPHLGVARLTKHLSPDDKLRRMVEWNTDLLMRLLNKIVATRSTAIRRRRVSGRRNSCKLTSNVTPVEDVTEILPMEDFVDKAVTHEIDPNSVEVASTVRTQLLDYITKVASMYRSNPFHNFEHACHVAMSASKIVMRIIQPDVEYQQGSLANRKGQVEFRKKIHHSTFGISSDVLMQFAVVFSAVIHDVDHTGVANAQLVKEAQEVAVRYGNKCVAEQNSVDIAWNLLMQDQYRELRQCICHTEQEQARFRQLLVNAIIATDIADKDLQQRRKKRWDKAFHCGSEESVEVHECDNNMDRKATIVFEYIIQASDVSHTMQHWKVYKQWNERLFEERFRAFQCGREEQDPSIGWYKGEIWFFDNYIIPLAKKLETCGVFGVSSDEYLSYALENRREWELKGEDIVRGMVEQYGKKGVLESVDEIDV